MPRASIPKPLQAWFDRLAEAAGTVALERVRELLQDVSLTDVLTTAARTAARPKPARDVSPYAAACATLGVAPTAPRAVVDAAYRVQAAALHPDRARGREAEFRNVTQARDAIYARRGWKP